MFVCWFNPAADRWLAGGGADEEETSKVVSSYWIICNNDFQFPGERKDRKSDSRQLLRPLMFISHRHWDPRCETKHCHQLSELLLVHTGKPLRFTLELKLGMCEAKNSVHDMTTQWNKIGKCRRVQAQDMNASISTSTYKKSLKPLNWMSLVVCMVWYPVVCMVWYPGLHNCPNHRTVPANEADIIRNKTADTSQIHKQKQLLLKHWLGRWLIRNGRYHSYS